MRDNPAERNESEGVSLNRRICMSIAQTSFSNSLLLAMEYGMNCLTKNVSHLLIAREAISCKLPWN